ncbi:MAG: hypothetical protein SFW67_31510 [Myxococcaceae bacterium]|nr:hypothetical protein [Myxococcaceae bacterium]
MRVRFGRVLLVTFVAGCGVSDPQTLRPTATLHGAVSRPAGVTGDAWFFLYRPLEGLPAEPAVPIAVTAVSADQLERTGRYVFGEVRANPYRLFGLLDVDQDFRGDVDVLAQPTAGDRVGAGVELNLQPGRPAELDYRVDALVATEPPAFRVENATGNTFALDATDGVALTTLTLAADPLDRFEPSKSGFPVGLVDEDGDGVADDRDGDRVPDLTLTALLRWLPRPGQHRDGTDVVVPLVLNPAPFLSRLEGNVRLRLLVDRLSLTVLPQAQEVLRRQGRRELRPFGPPPVGDYELVLLGGTGQFWRVPNQLGDRVASQALRFRFDRAQP